MSVSKEAAVAVVTARPPTIEETGGFQSPEAKKAALKKTEVKEDDVVSGFSEPQTLTAVDLDEQEKLVSVRVKENCLNFRVGPKTFSVFANKTTVIPAYVARHLEEKGKL